ncbi:DUF1353 domain-containing protein [Blastococcus saxobsidens]|uniref:DUF1353 domain-containing protein n=1 Tax=Blastococcus saxobsidens (strain DD2) TaxID=1146883 RepID=H6RRX3_BLASD|nr:DUF1353 domain-containing protein [Blastococcus saxobsidens]CCG02967.1 conserved protein of unknown function [Blastococcus saxobsidens DD2]
MPFEVGDVVVRTLDDEHWGVVEPLVYRGTRDRFVVPAGFRTDFATVPRVVVWLVPRFGRYTAAAILHDWLCTVGIESGVVTAREADGVFRRVLRESGVPVVRRWLMWCGVRWGAFADPVRGTGWWRSAPGVLAISLMAAPVVVPPGLLIAAALLVYGAVEAVVALLTGSLPEDAGSFRT